MSVSITAAANTAPIKVTFSNVRLPVAANNSNPTTESPIMEPTTFFDVIFESPFYLIAKPRKNGSVPSRQRNAAVLTMTSFLYGAAVSYEMKYPINRDTTYNAAAHTPTTTVVDGMFYSSLSSSSLY